jgi:chromosome segregation ATPase
MKDIKTQLTELSVQIKPLDEHIKRIDQDVEDMIDTEKNKKINAADEQLNELNKAVADVDFKTANAEKLLEQYRTLIAGAKSKEAVHDA